MKRKTLVIISLVLIWNFFYGCHFLNAKDSEKSPTRKLIILSIDGFPGYYFQEGSPFYNKIPNLRKLKELSEFNGQVMSSYPSMTYPAHTSMLTGVDPAVHGIFFNGPADFQDNLNGDWYWFADDIRVKTIYNYATENGLKVGSIYWPVTVGAKIDYNIPQFWKNRTEYDVKFLRAMSTEGLYQELEENANVRVGEFSGDREKVLFAIEAWKKYQPDLMLIYTTDLDSMHHSNGVYSVAAGKALKTIDDLLGKLIKEIKLYKKSDLGLMIVSDHGFKRVDKVCYPNNAIASTGNGQWKYKFKTMGGVGVLLRNTNAKKLSTNLLKKMSLQIQEKCPGAIATFEGEDFKNLQTKFYGDTQMFLYTKENLGFSPAKSGWFQVLKGGYYNHGFLPDDKDMGTIHLFYPKGQTQTKVNEVKDVMQLGCEWMNIDCPKGIRKKD